jgi:diaminopimelate epimerase
VIGNSIAEVTGMHFTKMHGIGNDYVYVDGTREQLADPSGIAIRISDRHTGIGSDGLILINPSGIADFAMDMYNADGSRGKMCGNGIRCVGKYVYDHGLTDKTELRIETLAGIRQLVLYPGEDGKIESVSVDMGEPILTPKDIPVRIDAFSTPRETIVGCPVEIAGRTWPITCVSMGNPHCIVFVDEDVDGLPLADIGPAFEGSDLFPEQVNTEFVNVLSRDHLKMRVWERGSGETMACGTGACAVAVAGALNGLTDRNATVSLRGGDLKIRWDEGSGRVFMTGPAAEVFQGDMQL